MKSSSSTFSERTLQWAPAAVLVVAVALFVYGSNRGLDLTDEAYYLLNFDHGGAVVAQITYFWVYFSLPYSVLGESVAAIRIVGLALLIAAGGYFAVQLLRHAEADLGVELSPFERRATLFAVAASVVHYYAFFGSLRVPSYNLLSALCMLVLTGQVLGWTRRPGAAPAPGSVFVYGFVLSVLCFTKAPAAVLVFLMHLVFFLSAAGLPDRNRAAAMLLWLAAGGVANALLVTAFVPQWPGMIHMALRFGGLMQSHDLFGSIHGLRWDLQRFLRAEWPILLAVAGYLAFALRPVHRRAPSSTGWVLLGCMAAMSLWLASADKFSAWLFFLAAGLFSLWIVSLAVRPSVFCAGSDWRALRLGLFLALLPLCFSFGSNVSIAEHSKMASVFLLAACAIELGRLRGFRVLGPRVFLVTIAVLSLPVAWLQVAPLVDPEYVYRLRAPLREQNALFPGEAAVPDPALRMDRETSEELAGVLKAFRGAGFRRGDRLLDLTGDGPGIAYLLGAVPVGAPWILGGYAGSNQAAEFLLSEVETEQLRNAWLLTSTGNPLAIDDWADVVNRRLKGFPYEDAATATLTPIYGRGRKEGRDYVYTLWRPRRDASGPK